MKRELYKEFGDALDITTTQHYIVVHPRGEGGEWANRFEDLYRSFLAYFRVRGFQLEEPKFPLVAIVYPQSRRLLPRRCRQWHQACPQHARPLRPTHQSRAAVRRDGRRQNADWSDNADTIIHEATHQTAFNTGIHNRFARPAGLARRRAGHDVRGPRRLELAVVPHAQRPHQQGPAAPTSAPNLKNRKPGTFGNLIASDQMFKTDAAAAYAEAWAMTLFLCETRPRELAAVLRRRLADRADFSNYFATERVNDFAECFGSDFKQLEANFLNWMAEIR